MVVLFEWILLSLPFCLGKYIPSWTWLCLIDDWNGIYKCYWWKLLIYFIDLHTYTWIVANSVSKWQAWPFNHILKLLYYNYQKITLKCVLIYWFKKVLFIYLHEVYRDISLKNFPLKKQHFMYCSFFNFCNYVKYLVIENSSLISPYKSNYFLCKNGQPKYCDSKFVIVNLIQFDSNFFRILLFF